MSDAIPGWLLDALRELAELHRGEFSEGRASTGWFDGFWDFFAYARARLESAPAASAHGALAGHEFCVLAWMPEVPSNLPSLLRLDLFVGSKDRLSRASWPVSTVALDSVGRIESGPLPTREVDPATAAQLLAVGAYVQLGHSGPHLYFEGVPRVDARALDHLLLLAVALPRGTRPG